MCPEEFVTLSEKKLVQYGNNTNKETLKSVSNGTLFFAKNMKAKKRTRKKVSQHQKKASKTRFNRMKNNIVKPFVWIIANPLFIMLLLLVIIFGLIVIGHSIRNGNHEEEEAQEKVLPIRVFRIGTTPTVSSLAKIEKKNVIKVRAQKPGIVQKLYVKEGEHIPSKGKTLAYISDNYQGGNSATINRQIAQKQYQNTQETYPLNKDLIAKQKEQADKVDENSDELRKITEDSIDETKSLIDLNEEIITYLDENIERYEATDSGNVNRDQIAGAKQLKSSYQSALNGLKTSLRNAEYQTDDDEAYAELSDLTKDITKKQLELQEKALDLSLQISELQYRLAQVGESTAHPTSFSNGDVEKIHVRLGQSVNPGDVLFTISGCDKAATITALVTQQIAASISPFTASSLQLTNGQVLSLVPVYVSKEATDGTMYSVEFSLPEDVYSQVTDGEYLQIEIPVGYPDTSAVVPFIPLDAVYQSSEGAFVFIHQDGTAQMKPVQLGEVYGQFVQVNQGLETADQVILNRNVIQGDTVELVN